jgi:hypothetical protein
MKSLKTRTKVRFAGWACPRAAVALSVGSAARTFGACRSHFDLEVSPDEI